MKGQNAYERELKAMLQGERAIPVRGILTKNAELINEALAIDKANMEILDHPFLVTRSAGSLGVDLVAIRSDISFPIEVKSSKHKRIWFTSYQHMKEQAENMKKVSIKAGVLPIYAYRLKRAKGDAWRIFTLELEDWEFNRLRRRRPKRIYDLLSKINKTKSGSMVLVWDNGTPLHEFVNLLNSFDVGRTGGLD